MDEYRIEIFPKGLAKASAGVATFRTHQNSDGSWFAAAIGALNDCTDNHKTEMDAIDAILKTNKIKDHVWL